MSILRHPITMPALCASFATGLIAWKVDSGPVAALFFGVLAGAVFAVVTKRHAITRLRKGIGARPAHVGEFPRLHNIVDGLCLTHGMEQPVLSVIDSVSGNALAMVGPQGAELVLTTGAVDHLGLVELESLVAHLLVRCREPGLRTETVRAGMGSMGILSGGANAIGRDRVLQTDFEGADLTRFPPGMQSALRALVGLGSAVNAPSTTGALWLLQPDGRTDAATSAHPPVVVRIDALGER
ncbi:MAG TPA: hypothetical protein DGF10_05270 [Acidimicrobiaceae bacterium]|nr:hypothetical protein [Acidimicrobiaceae bacterium]|tara:strand:+ start:107 stop:826 length:720 start_codon:yes stop_codon:yes gene_type:complete